MLDPAKAFAALVVLVMAGCATNDRQRGSHATDWEAEDAPPARAVVPPAPVPEPAIAPVAPKITPAPTPTETWVSLHRWCKVQNLAPPTLLAMAPLPTFALKTAAGSLILRAGSQVAYWEGLDLRLGFAPRMVDGQPFVRALDLEKNILPLVGATPSGCPASNRVIVIDPGHGGENAGTKSVLGSRYEKEFTLDWARRLQRLLLTNGWEVFLTRSNDTDMALSNRVAFAQAHQAGLFLSLHFNSAAPDEGEAGLETYVLTPTGMPSTVTRGFADEPGLSFPNNAFDAQNLQVAVRIHREVLAVNGHRDRGVRRARFPGVLRGQERPAVLVEGGYLSNPHEAGLIATPAYRQKLAVAVARAIGQEPETSGQRAEASSRTNSP